MSMTQSAVETPQAPAAPAAPSSEVTPSTPSTDSYDNNGMQVVPDGVLDFNDEVIDETISDETQAQPADPQQPATPADPAKPDEQQPATPVQPAQPAATDTGLKLYADKFKTVQDLKNSYIELGGDPARFGDNVQLLEEAYAVRQSEFSRSRAQLAQPAQPAVPQKTFQELVREEYAKYDPTKFTTPQEMWEAQAKANEAAAARFEEQNQGRQQQQITPQEMDRQIKIVNNVHSIETKVPRLKTDRNFRNSFATHIRVMRDENRIPVRPDGTEDLDACMKDFISGQSGVFAEAQKAYGAQQDAKALSTTVATEGGAQAPGSGTPHRNSNDALVEDIIGAHNDFQRRYY